VFNTLEGFFIHRSPKSDKSQLLSFYSKSHGLIKLSAFSNKKGTVFLPFANYELEYAHSIKFSFGSIKTAHQLDAKSYHLDPIKNVIRFFICDVVYQTAPGNVSDNLAYGQLSKTHNELIFTDNLSGFPLVFLAQWMMCLGISPAPIHQANRIDLEEGVFMYNPKIDRDPGAETWNRLLNGEESIPAELRKRTMDLMLKYMSWHLPNFNVETTRNILHASLH